MKKATIKKRLKRALANFLKDELLEIASYNTLPPYPSIIQNVGEFGVVQAVYDIDLPMNNRYQPEVDYEKNLEEAKQKMWHSIQSCIEVEATQLLHPEYYNRRRVRLSIMVKNPNKINI